MFVLTAVSCAYHIENGGIYDANGSEIVPVVADVAWQRVSQNLWGQALDGAASLGATAVSVPVFWSVFDEDAESQAKMLSDFMSAVL